MCKVQNDAVTEMEIMDQRDFARFPFKIDYLRFVFIVAVQLLFTCWCIVSLLYLTLYVVKCLQNTFDATRLMCFKSIILRISGKDLCDVHGFWCVCVLDRILRFTTNHTEHSYDERWWSNAVFPFIVKQCHFDIVGQVCVCLIWASLYVPLLCSPCRKEKKTTNIALYDL